MRDPVAGALELDQCSGGAARPEPFGRQFGGVKEKHQYSINSSGVLKAAKDFR